MTIDTSRLSAAIKIRARMMDREMVDIVNTSAYYISLNTYIVTDRTTPATIDAGLEVSITTHSLTKTGRKSKSKKAILKSALKGTGTNQDALLAVLIIQARISHKSSQRSRYWLNRSEFVTGNRAQNQRAIAEEVSKMIKTRRRSSGFLASGWLKAIAELSPHAIKRGGISGVVRSEGIGTSPALRGEVEIAVGKSGGRFRAVIGNLTGLDADQRGANDALWNYSAPALQAAIDTESAGMEAWIEKHLDPSLRQFNTLVNTP